MADPAPTLGERRVRIGFNPSGSDAVARIKRAAADLIDAIAAVEDNDDPEVRRARSLGITAAETAAMWGAKAETEHPPADPAPPPASDG